MHDNSPNVLSAVAVLTCILLLILGWCYKPETEVDKKALPVIQAIFFWFFVIFWGAADVYLARPMFNIWFGQARQILSTVGQLYEQGL